jgi:hypothetical protein
LIIKLMPRYGGKLAFVPVTPAVFIDIPVVFVPVVPPSSSGLPELPLEKKVEPADTATVWLCPGSVIEWVWLTTTASVAPPVDPLLTHGLADIPVLATN